MPHSSHFGNTVNKLLQQTGKNKVSSTQEWAAAGSLYISEKEEKFWDPLVCLSWFQLKTVELPPEEWGYLVFRCEQRASSMLLPCLVHTKPCLDMASICWDRLGESSSDAESAFEFRDKRPDVEITYWQTDIMTFIVTLIQLWWAENWPVLRLSGYDSYYSGCLLL